MDIGRPASLALDAQFQDFVAIALAIAVRALEVHVGEQLHLDMLKTIAAAGGAAAGAGVEAEGSGRVAALLRLGQSREQLAHRIERADMAGRIGTRGAADG